MYAIIKTGGKQYRVSKGERVDVELLPEELGAVVEFKEVLFVHDGKKAVLGQPHIEGSLVMGKIVGHAAGPKIQSLKYKPSHNQYRRFGHRQRYTTVEVTEIHVKHPHKQHEQKHEHKHEQRLEHTHGQ
jgi:large subunit ribosomal protein L21